MIWGLQVVVVSDWHAQVSSLVVMWWLGIIGSGDVAYAGIVGADRRRQ